MKICIISNTDELPYGASTRPYYISKYLSQFGNELIHICNVDKASLFWQNNEDSGIRYINKNYNNCKIRIIRKLRNTRYVYKKIKQFDPDIIYPHQLGNAKISLWLKKFLNKKIIYDAHSSVFLELSHGPSTTRTDMLKKHKRIENKVLNKVDRIITVSNETKKCFMDNFNISSDKIDIVKNGVETSNFKPKDKNKEILKKLGISHNQNICVFTNPRGTFDQNDLALNYFFEMIPDIEKRIDNIKFLILGGGPEPDPPSKNVVYTGFVEDLPTYINLADVCIAPFPPRAVCGGTRNKICEYLACGKPTISTGEGMRGFDEAIPEEHYLLGVDKDDFVDKVVYCFNNVEQAKKIGKNARELSKEYDWRVLSKKVEKVLNGFLE